MLRRLRLQCQRDCSVGRNSSNKYDRIARNHKPRPLRSHSQGVFGVSDPDGAANTLIPVTAAGPLELAEGESLG
jgi:hypothetical protein